MCKVTRRGGCGTHSMIHPFKSSIRDLQGVPYMTMVLVHVSRKVRIFLMGCKIDIQACMEIHLSIMKLFYSFEMSRKQVFSGIKKISFRVNAPLIH